MTIEHGTEQFLEAQGGFGRSADDRPGSETKQHMQQVASTAVDEGKNVAHTAADVTKDVAQEVTARVAGVTGEARQQLTSVVEQAKGELRAQFDERGRQAATGLQTLADQLSALSQGRPEAAGQIGSFLDDAQHRVQAYAETLQRRGPQGLVDDVSGFARRRPGMFLLVAGAAGFAAGRLVRAGASAAERDSRAPSMLPPPTTRQIGSSYATSPASPPMTPEFNEPLTPAMATPPLTEPSLAERVQVERD